MSGKIDYDELDRAVSRASQSSQTKTKSTASKDFIAENGHLYIDMADVS